MVAAYLRGIANLPIWLIGTSRGTESAASLAIRLQDSIDGVIPTSSITVKNQRGTNILDLPLQRIRVPALVMAHVNDSCFVTPPWQDERIIDALANAPRRQLAKMEGGLPARAESCEALSAHGYYGIEPAAVEAMWRFLTAR